jgi:sensor histidine kinase regulating citrate/malate metabolism
MANKESNGKIMVSINRENDTISCVVEHNGIGREKAAQLKTAQPKRTRESLGLNLTLDRINIINRIKNSKASIILTDLYDESKNPIGTRVVVKLPLEFAF